MHFIINMAFMLIHISKLLPWVLEWHENFCKFNHSISVHIENVIFLMCSMRISPPHEILFLTQNDFVYTIYVRLKYVNVRRPWILHIIGNMFYILVTIMKELMKVSMRALMKECCNNDMTHHHIWRSLLQYQKIMKKCWPRIDRNIGLK